MAIEYTKIFHCKTLKNLPKFGFLVSKLPSGNPEDCVQLDARGQPMHFFMLNRIKANSGAAASVYVLVLKPHLH
jgi:hypothetical protein